MYNVYSLDQTLADQADLVKLCKHRYMRYNEIFPENEFYGINNVLKHYARLNDDYLLKVICPHGVYLHDSIWQREKDSILPFIYYYSKSRHNIYKSHHLQKICLPAAHPYLYVKKMLESSDVSRKGTIFFPVHSTQQLEPSVSHEYLATKLLSYTDIYAPITVCMYWRDIVLGHHLHYLSQGFKVVSAGHMYDPNFLYRLYHLCSMHEFSSSNIISGSCFYSIASGCKFFLIENTDFYYRKIDSTNEQPVKPDDNINQSFLNSTNGNTIEQISWVNQHLGLDFFKTPDELREELVSMDEVFKKSYYSIFYFPHYLKNKYEHIMSMLYFFYKKLSIFK